MGYEAKKIQTLSGRCPTCSVPTPYPAPVFCTMALPGPLYSTCMQLQMLHACDLNYGTLATERIPHTCGYNFCTIASGAADMEFVMDAWTLSV